jgi:hypothetical protein
VKDCAWELIYDRLRKQGKLENLKKQRPLRNFGASVKPGTYLVDDENGEQT